MKFKYSAVHKVLMGDLQTPVSTYLKVRDLFSQSVLMESSDYYGSENNRSFIGLEPIASFSVNHGVAEAKFPDSLQWSRNITDTYRVEDAFSDFLSVFEVQGEYARYCGVYGYTTFNAVQYFENIPIKTSVDSKNDAPDMLYILYKYIIVFNDFKSEMVLIEMQDETKKSHLHDIENVINNKNVTTYSFKTVGDTYSTISDEEHIENIRKAIAHCLKGDVFQIVLSRRFIQKYTGDDFTLYRALRSVNPSPYLFYFDFGGYRIFGSSPETHCKIEHGMASIDPIAGTVKRTGNPLKDASQTEKLLSDPKENAEHVMLVDLARNDLSRNCDDVQVDFFKQVQNYSHVIHLVSRVSGKLLSGVTAIKAFIDTFPAGTLSGAPKVKAMQLISQYEPHNRGAYGGCVGFIGFDGSLNQAITIRTFVSRNNELWFQAGGGIVAKSDEQNELQEVNNKLAALKSAIKIAEQI